jgi:hypothetical protein
MRRVPEGMCLLHFLSFFKSSSYIANYDTWIIPPVGFLYIYEKFAKSQLGFT